MVFLVNAVHFKDKWRYPFEARKTHLGTFYLSSEKTVTCDMMMLTENRDIRHGVSEKLDCQLLELPYEGEFEGRPVY